MRFTISKVIAVMAIAELALGIPSWKKKTNSKYEIEPAVNKKGKAIAPDYCLPPGFISSGKPRFSFNDFSDGKP